MALLENKKVHLNYEILETFEAGLVLFGYEVKSIRKGQGSLDGGRVIARGGEAFLVGVTVPAWQVANAPKTYDSERPRKLLLSKGQILQVAEAEGSSGLTIVPLSVYNKGRNLKLSLGIARGKKKYDKRQDIKKRDEIRSMRRASKQ